MSPSSPFLRWCCLNKAKRRRPQIGATGEGQFGGLPRNASVTRAIRKFTTEHTEHTEKFGVRKSLSLSVPRPTLGLGNIRTASSRPAFFSSPLPCVPCKSVVLSAFSVSLSSPLLARIAWTRRSKGDHRLAQHFGALLCANRQAPVCV